MSAHMSVAVIDIGSNSVRLLLWQGNTLRQYLNTTRLGEGAAFGRLNEQSIARTRKAVSDFAKAAAGEGLRAYAFATSAVRDAENRNELLNGILCDCGLAVDVLSGEEEALCAYLGALRGGDGGVIDIGGNSTELALGRDGRLLQSVSLPLGAVRQNTLFGTDRRASETYLQEQLCMATFAADTALPFFGVGGTITALAAYRLGLCEYDPARVDGCPLPLSFVEETVERLWTLSPEQRAQLPGISQTRAQIIHQGALVLCMAMRHLGLDEIRASVHDNLEGYAYLRRLN